MWEQINGLLSASVLMLGGALIIFIYNAYRETKQKTLLLLAVGLFILILGSTVPGLLFILAGGKIPHLLSQTISLCIQIPGILIMIYAALKG
jgi:hypothetical protein